MKLIVEDIIKEKKNDIETKKIANKDSIRTQLKK